MKKVQKLSLIITLIISFIFISSSSIKAQATTFYVATDGNDENNGRSIDSPLKTLQAARDKVREYRNSDTAARGDIVVNIAGGIYFLDQPLVFSSSDSGWPDSKTIFRGQIGQKVTISGGIKLENWSLDTTTKPGITLWKAIVPINPYSNSPYFSRQLYVNGKRATRARSNSIPSDIVQTDTGYRTSYASTMNNWNNIEDVEMVQSVMWKHYRCLVTQVEGNNIIMDNECFNNIFDFSPFNPPPSSLLPQYIENALELLDQPGEWHLNRNGALYYYPIEGQTLANSEFILPVLENLIEIKGESNYPVSHLTFTNLTFSHTSFYSDFYEIGGFAPQMFHIYWPDEIITNYPFEKAKVMPAAVNSSFSDQIFFNNTHFYHLGGVGLSCNKNCNNNQITDSHFADISSTAIALGENYNVSASQINTYEIVSNLFCNNALVKNNIIQDIGVEFPNTIAIFDGLSKDDIVENNEIFNTPYSSIALGTSHGLDVRTYAFLEAAHKIKNNYVSHAMKEIVDGGSLYATRAMGSPNKYTQISGNVFVNQEDEYGAFYLDDWNQYVHAYENVIADNIRSVLVKGGDQIIERNYWQIRYTNDVYFPTYSGANTCFFPPGENICTRTVTNNQRITNLSQIITAPGTNTLTPGNIQIDPPKDMQTIITNSGTEPGHNSSPSPALVITNPVASGQQQVIWDPVPGAKEYLLRINDRNNPWVCNGIDPSGDICISVPADTNSYTYNFLKDHTYAIWIHTVYGTENQYSDPASSIYLEVSLPGDANLDNQADMNDYQIWKSHNNKFTPNGVAEGDFNTDGKVDGMDFSIWREQYLISLSSTTNTPTPINTSTSTPSPTSTSTPTPTTVPPTSTSTPTPTTASSQNQSIIQGYIRDANTGLPLPTAYIRVIYAGIEIDRVYPNGSGYYSKTINNPGTYWYVFQARNTGYLSIARIQPLTAGQTYTLNFNMTPR